MERQGRVSKWLAGAAIVWSAMAVTTLLPPAANAGELDQLAWRIFPHPSWPEALEAAKVIFEKYPLGRDTLPDNGTSLGTAAIYGAATYVVGKDLHLKQNKPQEALALCEAYLKFFPNAKGFWPPSVFYLWATTSAASPLPPEEALVRAERLKEFLLDGNKLPPGTDVIRDTVLLYQRAGQKEQARKFLEDLPYLLPEIVEVAAYWKARVEMHMAAGEMDLAKQAAVAGYRLGPITAEAGKDEALQLLLRTLVVTDGRPVITGFLTYLQTGQGENPLAGMPALPMTEAQRQMQEESVGGAWLRAVNAYLLNGQYAEALRAAQMQTLAQGPEAELGVVCIARCFKAKDMCCLRANQYLQWAKTGQGSNPVGRF